MQCKDDVLVLEERICTEQSMSMLEIFQGITRQFGCEDLSDFGLFLQRNGEPIFLSPNLFLQSEAILSGAMLVKEVQDKKAKMGQYIEANGIKPLDKVFRCTYEIRFIECLVIRFTVLELRRYSNIHFPKEVYREQNTTKTIKRVLTDVQINFSPTNEN